MKYFPKWLGIAGAVLICSGILAVFVVLIVANFLFNAKFSRHTVGGLPQLSSDYVRMSDGVLIAVDVQLPPDLRPGMHIPALVKGTPYWRSIEYTFLGKALGELGLITISGEPDVPILTARGFAVLSVDTRGTGASFGHQDIMLSDREVRDFGEIIDWAARQSWSNGAVGAYGFSYRGMLAVSMASLGRPALKAIAPSFDFTDLYLTTRPGGILSKRFIRKWGMETAALNRGKYPCGDCGWLIAGPRRVDADGNGALIAAALKEHARNYNVYDCIVAAPNRDSPICTSNRSLSSVSELSRKAAIERSAVPIYITAGYLDATSPEEVLQRFDEFSNPQLVLLGAISHGGFVSTDPFARGTADANPSYERQIDSMADFFDNFLRGRGKPVGKSVRYQVLNGGGWRTDRTWPPSGESPRRLYFGAGHTLSASADSAGGADAYRIDFSATTGTASRYQSPVDLSRTRYPDRAVQDKKLLVYTSAPLAAETILAGNPSATLTLSSTATDGEVIVYLEHVSPEGTVTYLTEGALRLSHRDLSTNEAISADPFHTYLTQQTRPMLPGKATTVVIALFPVSVVFHRGDRIRVAIAGADADNFERIPAAGEATLTLSRGASESFVALPVLGTR